MKILRLLVGISSRLLTTDSTVASGALLAVTANAKFQVVQNEDILLSHPSSSPSESYSQTRYSSSNVLTACPPHIHSVLNSIQQNRFIYICSLLLCTNRHTVEKSPIERKIFAIGNSSLPTPSCFYRVSQELPFLSLYLLPLQLSLHLRVPQLPLLFIDVQT